MNKNDELQELRDKLEDSARELDVRLNGMAELGNPEQKKAEREVKDWKSEKQHIEPIREFRIPNELVHVILKTEHYNGLIFFGEGGIGKTVLTISAIKKCLKPTDWEYSNGYTTPLKLYEFLYKHRDKKVIILDDVEGIFNNTLSLSILKGALWDSDGRRIVQYSSTSDKTSGLPRNFIMRSKVIILCNHIPRESDLSTRAMITRTIPFEIRFTFEEKMRICKTFIHRDKSLKKNEKEFVNELLERHITKATKDFNFRTLKKLMAFVQYDREKAEKLFEATTEVDELKEAYLKAVKSSGIVKFQVKMFSELTGRSRRTFFNVKRQLGAKVQSKQDTALCT